MAVPALPTNVPPGIGSGILVVPTAPFRLPAPVRPAPRPGAATRPPFLATPPAVSTLAAGLFALTAPAPPRPVVAVSTQRHSRPPSSPSAGPNGLPLLAALVRLVPTASQVTASQVTASLATASLATAGQPGDRRDSTAARRGHPAKAREHSAKAREHPSPEPTDRAAARATARGEHED